MVIFTSYKRIIKGWFQKVQSSNPDVINCPKCNSQLTDDENYIYCSKCGFLLYKRWIIEAANILLKMARY